MSAPNPSSERRMSSNGRFLMVCAALFLMVAAALWFRRNYEIGFLENTVFGWLLSGSQDAYGVLSSGTMRLIALFVVIASLIVSATSLVLVSKSDRGLHRWAKGVSFAALATLVMGGLPAFLLPPLTLLSYAVFLLFPVILVLQIGVLVLLVKERTERSRLSIGLVTVSYLSTGFALAALDWVNLILIGGS